MASADLKPSDRINIITSINGIDFGEGGILTPATKETLGGVIVGDGLDVDEDGRISTTGGGGEPYKLPVASAETLGGVKVGTNLEITPEGVLNATAGGGDTYVLPVATATSLGGVKVGSGISVTEDGTISAEGGAAYELPIATADTLGGVKVGSGLTIDEAGILSAIGGAGGGSVIINASATGGKPYTVEGLAKISLTAGTKVTFGIEIDNNGEWFRLISVNNSDSEAIVKITPLSGVSHIGGTASTVFITYGKNSTNISVSSDNTFRVATGYTCMFINCVYAKLQEA